MNEYPYALFSAFSDNSYGGSKAALVGNAQLLSDKQMQHIAKEFSVPATGFIAGIEDNRVDIRFFSTQTEYPMCGHATIALATWLKDNKRFVSITEDTLEIELNTPHSSARIELSVTGSNRIRAMLALQPAGFEAFPSNKLEIAGLLDISPGTINPDLPIALTRSDFVHLVVPVVDLETMQLMKPNFNAITKYSQKHGIDTVMVFTTETNQPEHNVHCREFAPAVGTPEAPASGTTNRALACYLLENEVIDLPQSGKALIAAEQGVEMGRPSLVQTELQLHASKLISIRVGGVATQLIEGVLYFD